MTHPANLIIGHYERHAAAWDADRQNNGWNDKVWHDRFIDNLTAGARVLDLGCGSGRPVAQHMSQRGLRVTGVDSSRAMISLCRNRLPDQEWIVADMRELSLGRRVVSRPGSPAVLLSMPISRRRANRRTTLRSIARRRRG
jgi:SAM-dependent methyltransferase